MFFFKKIYYLPSSISINTNRISEDLRRRKEILDSLTPEQRAENLIKYNRARDEFMKMLAEKHLVEWLESDAKNTVERLNKEYGEGFFGYKPSPGFANEKQSGYKIVMKVSPQDLGISYS